MNRAERRRQQKASEKTRLKAPYNFSNFSLEQISKVIGARVESLKLYLMQRENEMRKEISEELISESQKSCGKQRTISQLQMFLSVCLQLRKHGDLQNPIRDS